MFARFVVAAALFAATAAAQHYEVGALHIAEPHARATAPGQPNGAAFLSVENRGAEADRLVAASSPAASAVEIHETASEDGVMRMRKLDAVEIAPGAPIVFAPGGLHIMLIGLTAPLKDGETVPLTLTFEKAGSVTVDLAIQKTSAPADHSGHDHGH